MSVLSADSTLGVGSLRDAAHHACPIAAACGPTRRKRKRSRPATVSDSHGQALNVPEDLLYAAIAEQIAEQRKCSGDLELLFPSSTLLSVQASVAAVSPALSLQPGDFVEWPSKRDTFGCIWSVAKKGRAASVEAVEFRRRPVDGRRRCALHPDGGGCWSLWGRGALPCARARAWSLSRKAA